MKIILPPLTQHLVRFDSLKSGDAFFTMDGHLAFRVMRYGDANAMVCDNHGCLSPSDYEDHEMVEPCEVTVTATRTSQKPAEDPTLNIAERELVRLDKKIQATKCYRDRMGCSLAEAKTVVDKFRDSLPPAAILRDHW